MTLPEKKRVPLTGYSNRLSARAGETIEFKLSSEDVDSNAKQAVEHDFDASSAGAKASLNHQKTVTAWLTQSVCADPNPAGPGIVEKPCDHWFPRQKVTIGTQDFQSGSYGISDHCNLFKGASTITLQATIWPTLSTGSIQSIISVGALSLCIGPDNSMAVCLGSSCIGTGQALRLRAWSTLQVRLQRTADGLIVLLQNQNAEPSQSSRTPLVTEHTVDASIFDETCRHSRQILIAAQQPEDRMTHFFNGKIESPRVCIEYGNNDAPTSLVWDFSRNMSSLSVPSSDDNTLSVRLVNYPTRAMTGSQWRGQEMSWRHAPELYGAIHFHEDDIVDFDWKTSFDFQIPENMPSGVYIMHISDGEHEDAMPFYVCAPKGKPGNRVCVLIPTFTYAIYGNHARPDWQPSWQTQVKQWNAYPYNPAEYPAYGLSTYNYHSDGSGICHASHLRPLFNLRPGYITFANTPCSGLRHFQADSHLLAWLDARKIDFDVITDRELHNEGVASISAYDQVLTTTHPEYHTAETLNALTDYRDGGGNLAYLGGNGFYWRIALHPENQSILEIRRAEDGIRAWAAEPGEYYQAFDGQYGGLWRRNGRPPQSLCGLGFSAQGQFNGSYYRKRPISEDLAWIFNGIDQDIIGDFGLSGGGAAGFELDRADTHLGTPTNATVIASSEQHGSDFILVPEEMLTHLTTLPGPAASELLRADILWFDVPGGGSVFSVGSITFCGSLPHNDFENSVSRLLQNVLDHNLNR